jgi:hypothetical protein
MLVPGKERSQLIYQIRMLVEYYLRVRPVARFGGFDKRLDNVAQALRSLRRQGMLVRHW